MQCFTINTGWTQRAPAWISKTREKWARIALYFLMFCSSRALLSCLLFFRMSDKKRGEMEREGSWRLGEEGRGRWRGCWHALVSNLLESIAQFICFVSTAMAEDHHTRRPLDSSYCPPPTPHPTTPPQCSSTPTHLFSCDTLSEGEVEAIHKTPRMWKCQRGSPYQNHVVMEKLQTYTGSQNIQRLHTHTHTHTFMNVWKIRLLCGFGAEIQR